MHRFHHVAAPRFDSAETPTATPRGSDCSPGYWSGVNNGLTKWNEPITDPQWAGAYAQPFYAYQRFDSYFTAYPTIGSEDMITALSNGGGPLPSTKAARELVASILSASWSTTYPYTITDLKARWTAAATASDETTANALFTSLFNDLTAINRGFLCGASLTA